MSLFTQPSADLPSQSPSWEHTHHNKLLSLQVMVTGTSHHQRQQVQSKSSVACSFQNLFREHFHEERCQHGSRLGSTCPSARNLTWCPFCSHSDSVSLVKATMRLSPISGRRSIWTDAQTLRNSPTVPRAGLLEKGREDALAALAVLAPLVL